MPAARKKKGLKFRIILLVIMLVICIVPTAAVSMALLDSAFSKDIETTTSTIQGQVLILCNQITSADYLNQTSDPTINSVIEQIGDIWNGRIQIMNSGGRILKDTYGVDLGRYNISEYVMAALSRQSVKYYNEDEKYIIIAQPLYSQTETVVIKEATNTEPEETAPAIVGAVLVTGDLGTQIASYKQLQGGIFMIWGATFILAVCIIFAITRYLTKPFKRLTNEIKHAADGDIDKVSVRNYAETAQISDSVNQTLTRLKQLDKSRQEFVSNVSHELKTPITSMRVLADSLNGMEEVPNEMYKEFMSDISNELERESRIIDSLLSIGQMSERSNALKVEPVNINDWVADILHRIIPIAKQAEVEVILESFRPVTADIDESKLALAITNLVENAIKYNNKGGWVKVSLNADISHFFIKVEDSGIGIPEESISHLFERFFRVDKDRSRATGGTGLGLAITKEIVALHHGAIKVYSRYGEGSTFVIRIPLTYKENERTDERDINEENI